MEPKEYMAAVCRRWVWVVAAAVAGAAVGLTIALASPVTYRSTATLYLGVTQVNHLKDLELDHVVREHVLPSFAELTTAPATLQPVVADLNLAKSPQALARDIDVNIVQDTSIVEISAAAPTRVEARRLAEAVSASAQSVANSLYTGGRRQPVIRFSTVGEPTIPTVQAAPNKRRSTAVGLVVGGLAAVLAVGLLELLRPKVRNAYGAGRVTSEPVVEVYANEPGRRHRHRGTGHSRRAESLERLSWMLRTAAPVTSRGRFALVGSRAAAGALVGHLAVPSGSAQRGLLVGTSGSELDGPPARDDDPHVVDATGLPLLPGAGAGEFDGLVVAVDGRRTSRRALAQNLADARRTGIPVVGVAINDVLPDAMSWRARLVAGLRGEFPLQRDRWTHPPDQEGRSPARLASSARITAVAALLLVGLDLQLPVATSSGLLTVVALLPVWVGVLPRYRGAVALFLLGALALACGMLLAGASAVNHGFDFRHAAEGTFLVVTALGTVGLLLWARTLLPLAAVGTAYGLGMLAAGLARAPASPNPVKYELSLPLTIVVLSLVGARRRPVASLVALGALGVLDIIFDARSAFAFCVIAAALVLWQLRPAVTDGRPHRLVTVGLLVVLGAASYFTISQLLISGALGAEVQARTTAQIARVGGSLLLGGRPEWTATAALMQDHPLGYGVGIAPNGGDIAAAKAGFVLTYIPDGEHYLENYMLGDGFELHSVAADMWAILGPLGFALGLAMAVLLIYSLVERLSTGTASVLVCFMALRAVWYLGFGPLPSNVQDVAFALGIVLILRARGLHGGPAMAAGDREFPRRRGRVPAIAGPGPGTEPDEERLLSPSRPA